MARAIRPTAARPTKLFKLASCTAAAFKLEMVGGAGPLVGVAVEVKVTPYKTSKCGLQDV